MEEIWSQLHGVTPDLVVLSVGGGGLMNGVLEGLHRIGWVNVPVLAMETVGADSLNACVQAGQWVALDRISRYVSQDTGGHNHRKHVDALVCSVARCLGAKRVCKASYEWLSRHPVISHVVSDQEAVSACVRIADDHKILVPPSCGASLAAVYGGSIKELQQKGTLPQKMKDVVIIVCGGNGVNLDAIQQWRTQYNVF